MVHLRLQLQSRKHPHVLFGEGGNVSHLLVRDTRIKSDYLVHCRGGNCRIALALRAARIVSAGSLLFQIASTPRVGCTANADRGERSRGVCHGDALSNLQNHVDGSTGSYFRLKNTVDLVVDVVDRVRTHLVAELEGILCRCIQVHVEGGGVKESSFDYCVVDNLCNMFHVILCRWAKLVVETQRVSDPAASN